VVWGRKGGEKDDEDDDGGDAGRDVDPEAVILSNQFHVLSL